jgi:hypothetical protein
MRRGHERTGEHAQPSTAELRRERSPAGEAARLARLGAAQLGRDDYVTGAKTWVQTTRDAYKGDGRLLIKPRGELGAGASGAFGPGADDDIRAADGKSFDSKRRENLELSRRDLR